MNINNHADRWRLSELKRLAARLQQALTLHDAELIIGEMAYTNTLTPPPPAFTIINGGR